jgi:predicted HAD superfamily hydrolase
MKTGSRGARIKADAQIAAYSFDIFDTFLLRSCVSSQGVYERAFQLSAASRQHPDSAQAYIQHRIRADSEARHKAKEKTGSSEVTIEDIYSYFPFRLFGLDRTALQDLVDAEFQAELDLCRINDEVLHLYRNAQDAGHRVGFISDTYWSEQQIAILLHHCKQDLRWDFLYASCEHGTSKGEKLFARYLSAERIDPAQATHIGDNPVADIKSAHRHGIRGRFYPQASRPFTAVLERESSAFDLLCGGRFLRLDNGYRTLRRIVTARAPERSPAFQLGITTIGPAIAAFDAFIADRVAKLHGHGKTSAVAFLGRDGFLSNRIWSETRDDEATYLEISRRVALIGSAATLDPLIDLFNGIGDEKINVTTFLDILKCLPPSVAAFFAQQTNNATTGHEFAKALPQLIQPKQMASIAAAMRHSLLSYLGTRIPNLRNLTDLTVVDIGYCGSIQKSLRRIFDLESLNIRIHGLYLSTHDEAFYDLAADDTAEGFISDLVVTPHVKRMFNRNATVIEQVCCSATGSVRNYEDTKVLYEPDRRSSGQIETSQDVQNGALAFVKAARELAPQYRLRPFDDLDTAAKWTAAILARLILMPTERELAMVGAFKHDLNLGSESVIPMVDSKLLSQLEMARGLPAACAAPAPPMWLGGSFAGITPASGYLYMLFGANRLPGDIFGETKHTSIGVGLFGKDGAAAMEQVAVYRNGMGDFRVRVPLTRSMNIDTIAIPLAGIAKEAILRGVCVQHGTTAQQAAAGAAVEELAADRITTAGLDQLGSHYKAIDTDGCLLIKPAPLKSDVMILIVGLSPLDTNHMSPAGGMNEFEDVLKSALFRPSMGNTTAQ